jgi:hypothetical protein
MDSEEARTAPFFLASHFGYSLLPLPTHPPFNPSSLQAFKILKAGAGFRKMAFRANFHKAIGSVITINVLYISTFACQTEIKISAR